MTFTTEFELKFATVFDSQAEADKVCPAANYVDNRHYEVQPKSLSEMDKFVIVVWNYNGTREIGYLAFDEE